MSTEIQSLKDAIAERVGKELITLIPKEQWDQLVQGQIDHFMSHTAPGIIKEELTKSLRGKIADHLGENKEWDDSCQNMVNPIIKEIILKSAPEIMAAMLAPIMTGTIEQLRQSLYNNGGYRPY